MAIMYGYAATMAEETIIVALSHDKKAIPKMGCDDFVTKPCSAEYIFEVMKKHLKVEYEYGDEKPLEIFQPVSGETKQLSN